jgi:hypothetical protein
MKIRNMRQFLFVHRKSLTHECEEQAKASVTKNEGKEQRKENKKGRIFGFIILDTRCLKTCS